MPIDQRGYARYAVMGIVLKMERKRFTCGFNTCQPIKRHKGLGFLLSASCPVRLAASFLHPFQIISLWIRVRYCPLTLQFAFKSLCLVCGFSPVNSSNSPYAIHNPSKTTQGYRCFQCGLVGCFMVYMPLLTGVIHLLSQAPIR